MMSPPPPIVPSVSSYGGGNSMEDAPVDQLEGTMDLLVVLPNSKSIQINVNRRTPMMDLLIQVTTSQKINPGGHIVQVRNEIGRELQYQPNTPIGALDTSTIQIIPKNQLTDLFKQHTNKTFEHTFRLQVHLPRNQLYVMRVGPKTLLENILREVCSEKNLDINKYELRHPVNFDEKLKLDSRIGELQQLRLVSKNSRLNNSVSTADILAYSENGRRGSECGLDSQFKYSRSSVGESSLSSESALSRSDESRSISPLPILPSKIKQASSSQQHFKKKAPPPPPNHPLLSSSLSNPIPLKKKSTPPPPPPTNQKNIRMMDISRNLTGSLSSIPISTQNTSTHIMNSGSASNLSSGLSISNTSIASSSGKNKRRAPKPPLLPPKEQEENNSNEIVENDYTKVTEEMKKDEEIKLKEDNNLGGVELRESVEVPVEVHHRSSLDDTPISITPTPSQQGDKHDDISSGSEVSYADSGLPPTTTVTPSPVSLEPYEIQQQQQSLSSSRRSSIHSASSSTESWKEILDPKPEPEEENTKDPISPDMNLNSQKINEGFSPSSSSSEDDPKKTPPQTSSQPIRKRDSKSNTSNNTASISNNRRSRVLVKERSKKSYNYNSSDDESTTESPPPPPSPPPIKTESIFQNNDDKIQWIEKEVNRVEEVEKEEEQHHRDLERIKMEEKESKDNSSSYEVKYREKRVMVPPPSSNRSSIAGGGGPSIQLGTWGERPRGSIVVKDDVDYIMGMGQQDTRDNGRNTPTRVHSYTGAPVQSSTLPRTPSPNKWNNNVQVKSFLQTSSIISNWKNKESSIDEKSKIIPTRRQESFTITDEKSKIIPTNNRRPESFTITGSSTLDRPNKLKNPISSSITPIGRSDSTTSLDGRYYQGIRVAESPTHEITNRGFNMKSSIATIQKVFENKNTTSDEMVQKVISGFKRNISPSPTPSPPPPAIQQITTAPNITNIGNKAIITIQNNHTLPNTNTVKISINNQSLSNNNQSIKNKPSMIIINEDKKEDIQTITINSSVKSTTTAISNGGPVKSTTTAISNGGPVKSTTPAISNGGGYQNGKSGGNIIIEEAKKKDEQPSRSKIAELQNRLSGQNLKFGPPSTTTSRPNSLLTNSSPTSRSSSSSIGGGSNPGTPSVPSSPSCPMEARAGILNAIKNSGGNFGLKKTRSSIILD